MKLLKVTIETRNDNGQPLFIGHYMGKPVFSGGSTYIPRKTDVISGFRPGELAEGDEIEECQMLFDALSAETDPRTIQKVECDEYETTNKRGETYTSTIKWVICNEGETAKQALIREETADAERAKNRVAGAPVVPSKKAATLDVEKV